MLKKILKKTHLFKGNIAVLALALKEKRVPKRVKIFVGLVVLYALSPIDFIPDFIPILGYLDDLILLPLGIYLALKLIPKPLLAELQNKAKTLPGLSKIKWAALLIIGLWLSLIAIIIFLLFQKKTS